MAIATRTRTDATVEHVSARAFTVPTDAPEADGTLSWESTTLVVAEVSAGEHTGLGYTYGDAPCALLITGRLAGEVEGRRAMDIEGAWRAMVRSIRNLGRPGICSMSIAAVDCALWDLKARLLGLPLVTLLGAARDGIPVYGSGGFTSYPIDRLQQQLGQWSDEGFPAVKMKVGEHPGDDVRRVDAARRAIGRKVELFVDANGAYDRKQALGFAAGFAEFGVTWFEEPVGSDDLDGLRLIRDRAPAGMRIAAGEYGWDPPYFRRMLDSGAVDVLQADATRCGGFTGFMRVAALCEAANLPMSAHTAPALHVHPCCAVGAMTNLEYFHDHARIEHMLFDGVASPVDGVLRPDLGRPGLGLELKRADAEAFAA